MAGMKQYHEVRCQHPFRYVDGRNRLVTKTCNKLLFKGEMVGAIKCKKCHNISFFGVSKKEILPDAYCGHKSIQPREGKSPTCGRLLFEGRLDGKIKCTTCGHVSHFTEEMLVSREAEAHAH